MGYFDATKLPREKESSFHVDTLQCVMEPENKQHDQDLGDIKRVVMHWSVGNYTMCFNAYHYCIVYDKAKDKAHVVKALKLSEMGQHAYMFNSHSVGVSFMAEARNCPVTEAQIRVGAKFVAELCAWKGLDPRDLDQLMDHYQADKVIGRNQKQDIQRIWKDFQSRVVAEYDLLKTGKSKFEYKALLLD